MTLLSALYGDGWLPDSPGERGREGRGGEGREEEDGEGRGEEDGGRGWYVREGKGWFDDETITLREATTSTVMRHSVNGTRFS